MGDCFFRTLVLNILAIRSPKAVSQFSFLFLFLIFHSDYFSNLEPFSKFKPNLIPNLFPKISQGSLFSITLADPDPKKCKLHQVVTRF